MSAETTEQLPLWWLSFVDPDKSAPRGEQVPGGGGFLGVVIVAAENALDAASRAWDLEINPGGEVAILGPMPSDTYGPEVRNRLLSADEAMEL